MIALIARVTDTHANLWSVSPQLRPPLAAASFRWHRASSTARPSSPDISHAPAGPATGLQIGDVIETLDGEAVQKLVERWEPYYPASNQPSRLRDISRALTRGACAVVRVGFRRAERGGRDHCAAEAARDAGPAGRHDARSTGRNVPAALRRGRLSEAVVGASCGGLQIRRAAKGTQGLVVDIRNYPSQFVVFALGSLLVENPRRSPDSRRRSRESRSFLGPAGDADAAVAALWGQGRRCWSMRCR